MKRQTLQEVNEHFKFMFNKASAVSEINQSFLRVN